MSRPEQCHEFAPAPGNTYLLLALPVRTRALPSRWVESRYALKADTIGGAVERMPAAFRRRVGAGPFSVSFVSRTFQQAGSARKRRPAGRKGGDGPETGQNPGLQPFIWRPTIHDDGGAASVSLSKAKASLIAFGNHMNK
jgi:hypothetical protein